MSSVQLPAGNTVIDLPETESASKQPTTDQAWFEHICETTGFSPLKSFEIQQIPELDEPAARSPFQDPVFGTCLVRVTDRSARF